MAKTKKQAKPQAQTLLTFIGGVNKDGIGGNCSVIEHTDENGHVDRAMFDLGCKFTPLETGFFAAYPNVEDYFDREDPKTGEIHKAPKPVSALFITHAHEDHIGALVSYAKMGYKLPPIKTGGFSRSFIRLSFREEGLPAPEIERIKPGDNVSVGENMVVEAVGVSHSIVDAIGFHTLTFSGNDRFTAIVNNGDFLAEEEMPVGRGFNKEEYLDIFKRKQAPTTLICLDSTSTEPSGKKRIGFDKAVENTVEAINRNPDRNIVISPVITRSIQNIAIDMEAARKIGTKVYLDGKWLQLVKEAMNLSGYRDFEDVLYKGSLQSYLQDKQVSKKYIVCTGAFAQGLYDYEQNQGLTPTSFISMASATKMALDLHPYIRINKDCLILSRQRIIDEINGKTGPQMLQLFAAQGAKVIMTPGSRPISNFEQIQMQDSGHVNAQTLKELMKDVKSVVPDIIAVPIHGSPEQCQNTKAIMDEIGIQTQLAANHQTLKVDNKQVSLDEKSAGPVTWYAVKLILPNPLDERLIPAEGINEYWKVNEDYTPIEDKPAYEIANCRRYKPNDKGYRRSIQNKIDEAEQLPTHGKMFKKKQSSFVKKRDGRG